MSARNYVPAMVKWMVEEGTQEHLQRQLDIHERGNCRSISCSRKQRD